MCSTGTMGTCVVEEQWVHEQYRNGGHMSSTGTMGACAEQEQWVHV